MIYSPYSGILTMVRVFSQCFCPKPLTKYNTGLMKTFLINYIRYQLIKRIITIIMTITNTRIMSID